MVCRRKKDGKTGIKYFEPEIKSLAPEGIIKTFSANLTTSINFHQIKSVNAKVEDKGIKSLNLPL